MPAVDGSRWWPAVSLGARRSIALWRKSCGKAVRVEVMEEPAEGAESRQAAAGCPEVCGMAQGVETGEIGVVRDEIGRDGVGRKRRLGAMNTRSVRAERPFLNRQMRSVRGVHCFQPSVQSLDGMTISRLIMAQPCQTFPQVVGMIVANGRCHVRRESRERDRPDSCSMSRASGHGQKRLLS